MLSLACSLALSPSFLSSKLTSMFTKFARGTEDLPPRDSKGENGVDSVHVRSAPRGEPEWNVFPSLQPAPPFAHSPIYVLIPVVRGSRVSKMEDVSLRLRSLEIRVVKNLTPSRRDKERICPGHTKREFTETRDIVREKGRMTVFVIITLIVARSLRKPKETFNN